MKNIIVPVLFLFAFSSLNAQVTKKTKKEKSVSVNINTDNDVDRRIKIVTEEDGVEKVIEWTDQGEIPAEIMEKLEEQGIDVELLGEEGGENIFIEIKDNEKKERKEIKIKRKMKGDGADRLIWHGDDGDVHIIRDKEIKIIALDEYGDKKVIEWDGEGEMPEELREHMEDLDFEIDKDFEGHRRIRMHRDGDHDVRIRRGPGHNGDRRVMIREGNRMIDGRQAKVFVGARVEGHDEGASVLEVMEDSPASKAKLMKGDVITKINGARTRSVEGFLSLLHHFDAGDKIALTILRGGKMMDLDLTLQSRPEDFR